MDNNLVYFIGQVRSAIMNVDPTALVTVSFFVPQTPNATRVGDTRVISTEPAICCSTADFIDLHPYIDNLTLPQMVQNFGSAGLTAKPLVMGEFGATLPRAPDARTAAAMFQQWQTQSCSLGFTGWLLWNWDLTGTAGTDYWTAMADSGTIDAALRPSTRPNACLAGLYPNEDLSFGAPGGATATASNSLADNPPAPAVDGQAGTWWSAGAFALQWIQIDLPTPSTVNSVNLTVSQLPNGPTVHDPRRARVSRDGWIVRR